MTAQRPPHRVYHRTQDVMEAAIDEDLVALDLRTGACFGFNPVAAIIWQKLSSPRSFEELRDDLLAEFDVAVERCTADLHDLLEAMTAEGLIREAD